MASAGGEQEPVPLRKQRSLTQRAVHKVQKRLKSLSSGVGGKQPSAEDTDGPEGTDEVRRSRSFSGLLPRRKSANSRKPRRSSHEQLTSQDSDVLLDSGYWEGELEVAAAKSSPPPPQEEEMKVYKADISAVLDEPEPTPMEVSHPPRLDTITELQGAEVLKVEVQESKPKDVAKPEGTKMHKRWVLVLACTAAVLTVAVGVTSSFILGQRSARTERQFFLQWPKAAKEGRNTKKARA